MSEKKDEYAALIKRFYDTLQSAVKSRTGPTDAETQRALYNYQNEFINIAREAVRLLGGIPEDGVLIPDHGEGFYDGGEMKFIPPHTLLVTYRANCEDGWTETIEIDFYPPSLDKEQIEYKDVSLSEIIKDLEQRYLRHYQDANIWYHLHTFNNGELEPHKICAERVRELHDFIVACLKLQAEYPHSFRFRVNSDMAYVKLKIYGDEVILNHPGTCLSFFLSNIEHFCSERYVHPYWSA